VVDAGTIRIIDLAFVIKGADGTVGTAELADLDSDVYKAFDALSPETMGLLNEEDPRGRRGGARPELVSGTARVGGRLGDQARDAIVAADGELLDLERVPYEVVQAAVDFAEANK
jgi:hypothetical protein